jgi:hypothetical protein
VARVYHVIDRTRSATRYLHRLPVLSEKVPEVQDDL